MSSNGIRIWIFRILMLLYLAAVALLCFANLGSLGPKEFLWGIPSDKLAHVFLFLPFPLLAWGCTASGNKTVPGILCKIIIIFLLGAAWGFSTEFIQGYLPNRARDNMDLLADLCGITACCLGIVILKLCAQKEA